MNHTSEGRKRARAHGVLFGRPRKLTPHQRREAIARRDAGDETKPPRLQSSTWYGSSKQTARNSCGVGSKGNPRGSYPR
jgi:hypothetical protein